ncbi:MAG: hypothetical protein JNM17_03375 [Archangium sp.]|nr:hypothetical protein [Archangium sp.]
MSAQSRFLSNIVLAAAVMSASGCICVTGGGNNNPGDISFTWTFNGRTCMQSQDITTIFIQIPGQTLQNDGRYGCINGGSPGIKLLNFRGGPYTYTITAQDSRGVGIFQATGTVRVNGDVVEMVDLKPTGQAAGTAFVAVTIPQGSPVTCEYLSAIDITLDNATTVTTTSTCNAALYNPNNTTSAQGVQFTLTPGQHTIQIDARDAANIYYYRKVSTFTVNAAETTQQIFSLDWLVGTVPIRFGFSNTITQLNCAQAGVTEVQITFRDTTTPTIEYVQNVPCTLNGIDGYTPYIDAGTYQVFVAAIGTGGAQYNNFRATSPAQPIVTAQAGVFPALQSNSTLTILSSM